MTSHRFSGRRFVPAGTMAAALAILLGIVPSTTAVGADGASEALAFVPAGNEYHFDTGVLRGTLREKGGSLGLKPLIDVATGTPLAGLFGLFSPYRLLTTEARFGTAAWDWPSQSQRFSDGAVEAHWLPDKEHPLDMKAVYRFAAPSTLDFRVTVKPQRRLRRFEVFLSSYLAGFPASFVYVRHAPQAHGEPGFLPVVKEAGEWQMFPRDEEAVRMIGDGRWNYLPNAPVPWKVMPRLAAPLGMRRDAKTGLTAVFMAAAEDCFAVSTPHGEDFHRSMYLSLFGRDIEAGETASARARLVIGKGISDQQAIDLYEAYRTTLKQ